MCGKIVWLQQPNDPATGKPALDDLNPDPAKRTRPVMGLRIVIAMRPSGTPDQWAGQFYNPNDGRTYPGRIALLSPTQLRVEGCLGPICSGETWTRVQ